MPDLCPWCGSRAINITTLDHRGPDKFICAGREIHEWLDGEGPEPPPFAEDIPEPGLLDRVATFFKQTFRK